MSIPRIAGYTMPALPSVTPRVTWQPDPARAVLLIHDMQRYFLDFYAADAEPIPSLLAAITRLRDACDAAGVPVFYSRQPGHQTSEQRGLLQDWWGPGVTAFPDRADIVHTLVPRPGDHVLTKWRYSAFARTDLRQQLDLLGRDQILICGVYAHIGCQMTAADAFMQDIQPFLVADAVADFSAAEHLQALQWVAARCGVVVTTAHVESSLSGHPSLPASLHALRDEIASLADIPVDQLEADDNPFYAGLDSIRLMALIERWNRAGCSLGFADLVERPSLRAWWEMLDRQKAA
ncbi:isochorismatase family protein [Tahibacter amnicola]|uniref:isochorismatase n=1 Tax=Tahibacter amnicola TaxID=2976241 RepID=A0ABY6BAR0_9GAMM|nr:isochorismatase family protein [Tahibacter amnicola]UXI66616.1 isochorismatase family protein [Tahibacter amnicola]